MTHHDLSLGDETPTEDSMGSTPAPERFPYTVLSEAGLTKRGEHYPQGSTVELDKTTAAAFIANGDIEEQA